MRLNDNRLSKLERSESVREHWFEFCCGKLYDKFWWFRSKTFSLRTSVMPSKALRFLLLLLQIVVRVFWARKWTFFVEVGFHRKVFNFCIKKGKQRKRQYLQKKINKFAYGACAWWWWWLLLFLIGTHFGGKTILDCLVSVIWNSSGWISVARSRAGFSFRRCIMRFRRQNSIILSLNEVKTNKNRGVKSIAQTNGNMQPPKFIRNGTSMKKTVALIGRYLFDYSFALVHFV